MMTEPLGRVREAGGAMRALEVKVGVLHEVRGDAETAKNEVS